MVRSAELMPSDDTQSLTVHAFKGGQSAHRRFLVLVCVQPCVHAFTELRHPREGIPANLSVSFDGLFSGGCYSANTAFKVLHQCNIF